MLDDLFKLLRNSPKWTHMAFARRLGFHLEPCPFESSVSLGKDSCNWTKISSSGELPAVRSGHSALVIGSTMYVFGGYNEGNCHNDLHTFDLLRHHWTRLEPVGGIRPDGRASHAWCSSTDESKLYLFGGSGPHWGQTNMGKLLQYHIRLKQWSVVPVHGAQPPPGYGQSLCSVRHKLYLFGGTSGHVYVNDLYVFDEKCGTWRKEETFGQRPSPRYKHQAIAIHNRMYVIGGGLYDPPKGDIDVYYLDVETLVWHRVNSHGNVPRSRIAHSICPIISSSSKILMFGGRDDSGSRSNELSQLDIKTGEWSLCRVECEMPDPCDFHTAVVYQQQMFVFGGSNGAERNNSVYRYTILHQPSTLMTIAMLAIREQDAWKSSIEKLPWELKLGVQYMNPHVVTTENLAWYR